jgi:hypothetical protein
MKITKAALKRIIKEEVLSILAEDRGPRLQSTRRAKMASRAANDERGNIDWNTNDLNDALRNQDWEKATNLANKIKEEFSDASLEALTTDVWREIDVAIARAKYRLKMARTVAQGAQSINYQGYGDQGDESQLAQQNMEKYKNEIAELNEFGEKLRAWRAEFTKGLH